MSTTDRTGADTATFEARMAELDRLEVADEDTVERVARAIADTLGHKDRAWYFENYRDIYVRYARAAIDALKPAPGTDSSGQVVQRDENVVTCTHDGQPEHVWQPGEACPDAIPAGTWAVRTVAVVAGPQCDHDEEGGQ